MANDSYWFHKLIFHGNNTGFKRESSLNRPFRYPIKAFGYDKNSISKNLTGWRWVFLQIN
ncbi:MAG: hypothetical protein K8F52_02515 [Candidatus Scalindua rubra]|nr:hypothetical protein [Candidatus Scalindua rubra]TWU34728.1 hypothetical protein S225a_10860 [Candidatus Brocadiaceae bacterium S225]